MNKLEQIRSNIEVHGLEWAAELQQARMRKDPRGCNSFDTFYYVVFGKFPTRKFSGRGISVEIITLKGL